MTDQEYESFCQSIWKDFPDKAKELLVVGIGVAGEAGEFADQLKKAVTYEREPDFEKCAKELGDIEYYLAIARSVLKVTRQQVLALNVQKLKARHPSGFNTAAETLKTTE